MINPLKIHPEADAERFLLMLIGEELKSIRFFNTLMDLGLDHSHYQPHLDAAILTGLGITDESNETYDFYFAVMNEHAARIGPKAENAAGQARVVYEKLSRLVTR